MTSTEIIDLAIAAVAEYNHGFANGVEAWEAADELPTREWHIFNRLMAQILMAQVDYGRDTPAYQEWLLQFKSLNVFSQGQPVGFESFTVIMSAC